MIPSRFLGAAPSSGARKSRLETGKPSLLPKPRQTNSTDRMSTEAHRPSGSGFRSSSAEPSRSTIGSRLSKDTSVKKQAMNARARSQQTESRYKQSMTTPLHSGQYSRQATTPMRAKSQQTESKYKQSMTTPLRFSQYSKQNTPMRTPEDRTNRKWEAPLDRASAFVTVKDQRPLSSAAWQRAESARVSEALAARMEGGAGALIRPLTIARFLDIVSMLLSSMNIVIKLNNDNYVTKLPNLCKRLLYPGTLSKSWLRAVNTLHAFPHALALIAYLLDLVDHIAMPVEDEWLYRSQDELARLRRNFLHNCWMRFQVPGSEFSDLDEEYLQNLKRLLGNDDEKIAELKQTVKKYECALEDEAELAARADEARRVARRDALVAEQRTVRAAILEARSRLDAARATPVQQQEAMQHLDLELEKANAENEQLSEELAQQPLSVDERSKLLDELKYTSSVLDSKRALVEQVSQVVQDKDEEIAQRHKKALHACFVYKQGLVHLTAQFPELSAYAIDENELMSPSCVEKAAACVRALEERSGALADERSRRQEERAAAVREHRRLLEEVEELTASTAREQSELDSEVESKRIEAEQWERENEDLNRRIAVIGEAEERHAAVDAELVFWQKQAAAWRVQLDKMRERIEEKRGEADRELRGAIERRKQLALEYARRWIGML